MYKCLYLDQSNCTIFRQTKKLVPGIEQLKLIVEFKTNQKALVLVRVVENCSFTIFENSITFAETTF